MQQIRKIYLRPTKFALSFFDTQKLRAFFCQHPARSHALDLRGSPLRKILQYGPCWGQKCCVFLGEMKHNKRESKHAWTCVRISTWNHYQNVCLQCLTDFLLTWGEILQIERQFDEPPLYFFCLAWEFSSCVEEKCHEQCFVGAVGFLERLDLSPLSCQIRSYTGTTLLPCGSRRSYALTVRHLFWRTIWKWLKIPETMINHTISVSCTE